MPERRQEHRPADAPVLSDEERRSRSLYTETIARYNAKIKNPKTAIRAKCVECSGGSLKEVAECRVFKCALYPFRMGDNPFNKTTQKRLNAQQGIGSDDDSDE